VGISKPFGLKKGGEGGVAAEVKNPVIDQPAAAGKGRVERGERK